MKAARCVALALTNLASFYETKNDWEQAIRLMARVGEIREKNLALVYRASPHPFSVYGVKIRLTPEQTHEENMTRKVECLKGDYRFVSDQHWICSSQINEVSAAG